MCDHAFSSDCGSGNRPSTEELEAAYLSCFACILAGWPLERCTGTFCKGGSSMQRPLHTLANNMNWCSRPSLHRSEVGIPTSQSEAGLPGMVMSPSARIAPKSSRVRTYLEPNSVCNLTSSTPVLITVAFSGQRSCLSRAVVAITTWVLQDRKPPSNRREDTRRGLQEAQFLHGLRRHQWAGLLQLRHLLVHLLRLPKMTVRANQPSGAGAVAT
jgi:hypothetical protein